MPYFDNEVTSTEKFRYDEQNRVVFHETTSYTASVADGVEIERFVYDENNVIVSETYDGPTFRESFLREVVDGRIVRVTKGGESFDEGIGIPRWLETWSYDDEGRLAKREYTKLDDSTSPPPSPILTTYPAPDVRVDSYEENGFPKTETWFGDPWTRRRGGWTATLEDRRELDPNGLEIWNEHSSREDDGTLETLYWTRTTERRVDGAPLRSTWESPSRTFDTETTYSTSCGVPQS